MLWSGWFWSSIWSPILEEFWCCPYLVVLFPLLFLFCDRVLTPIPSHSNRLLKGLTSWHDPYQKEMGQGDWMPPHPNLCLLHNKISRYYSLKRKVTDWLKEGTQQWWPFVCPEYKSDGKSIDKNLQRETHAMASQLKKCIVAMWHKKKVS